jgi:E3 ubiquitin-protein ligase SH3RF
MMTTSANNGSKENAKNASADKSKVEKKVSLMKRWKRKSKSPPPQSSQFYCDNPSFSSDVNGQTVVLTNPSTSNLQTIHVRSGSCPSEALNGSNHHHHRKQESEGRGKQPAAPPLVRERFRCIVPYPPNSDYELELHEGDTVFVHKKRDDGWYKGTLQRTGKSGLFPSSFVEAY